MSGPQISDVFPFVSPTGPSSGDVRPMNWPNNLPPGYVELPDGSILDGYNARTIPVGTEEYYRIVGSARDADLERALDVRGMPTAARPISFLIPLGPGDTPMRGAATSDKVRTFLLLAAVVAVVIYATRK